MNENNLVLLSKEKFGQVIEGLKNLPSLSLDFLYDVYVAATEGIQEIRDKNIIPGIDSINPIELIYYCAGEYAYTSQGMGKEKLEEMTKDEQYLTSLASIASDKYISLSVFNHTETRLTNKFLPPISSIDLYLNFMHNIIQNQNKDNPTLTLVTDLLRKSVSISRSILNLITDGYETDAFALWRTLHECECTLIVLDNYGEEVISRYLKHMQYGYVFQKGDRSDEKGTAIFEEMKEEMRQHESLKSKDIKKFIEYGWLYGIADTWNDPNFKLNFRDGLEKYAGLSMYSKRYEISSEIVHSTPMLIYSNKHYFYYMTLLSVYESFFRLEKVFNSLFMQNLTDVQKKQYEGFRQIYYSQLVNIHKRETSTFANWRKAK